MAITGSYIMVNGIKIYYETNNGPVDRATIVGLHMAGRDSRQYHGMMDNFSDKYNMVALDMPAHGKSWPLPGNKAIDESHAYGDFAWAFIEEMGITNPVVIGGALGGNIVYYIAQKYPVKAIVSMQGAVYISGTANNTMLDLLDHPYVSPQYSHFDFTESQIGRNASDAARDFILWGVCQESGRVKKADLMVYNSYDVRDGLKDITCPVMVIRGEDDWNVPESVCQEAMKGLVNAQKVVWKPIPGYGHFIIVEAPEVLCEAIEEFLADM